MYPSIIVTPGSGGLGPEFHAWVTRGERGGYLCEPAMLSDGSGTAHDGSISREHLRRRVLTAGRILRTDSGP